MRMDKLTTKFQQALADAQSLAVGRDNQYIEPTHLMAALLDQQGGTARPLLEKANVQVPKLRSDLAGALDRIAKVEGAGGDVLLGNDLNKLLNVTDKLAQQRGDPFVEGLYLLADDHAGAHDLVDGLNLLLVQHGTAIADTARAWDKAGKTASRCAF